MVCSLRFSPSFLHFTPLFHLASRPVKSSKGLAGHQKALQQSPSPSPSLSMPPLFARTSPLYSEIQRFFVTLQRTPTLRPELALSSRALGQALSGGTGGGWRSGAQPTSRRAGGGLLATGERWAPLQHLTARPYSTCPSPNCPITQQSRRASTSSPPPPSSSDPSPPPPSSTPRRDDSHALANPEPHPLAKIEPHPLARVPSPAYLSSLPRYLRRAASSLPAANGRPPPKDQLLSLTNSFFERLKIRFKWATIRSCAFFFFFFSSLSLKRRLTEKRTCRPTLPPRRLHGLLLLRHPRYPRLVPPLHHLRLRCSLLRRQLPLPPRLARLETRRVPHPVNGDEGRV